MPDTHLPTRAHRTARQQAVYEHRTLTVDARVSKNDLRRQLAELAEYDGWSVHRVVLFYGGARRVWLRRKIIRVRRTA